MNENNNEKLHEFMNQVISRLDNIETRLEKIENSVLENTRKIDRNYKLIKKNEQSIKSSCKVFYAEIADKSASELSINIKTKNAIPNYILV